MDFFFNRNDEAYFCSSLDNNVSWQLKGLHHLYV